MAIKYSVVIPLKNEEENIVELIEELEPVMVKIGEPWELICVDDGSTDKTAVLLSKIASQKNYLRVLIFKKNYGQSSAFDAGFRAAQGEWVITLDGDRQNDPADIPKLLALSNEADLVCGLRLNRRDVWHKRWISRLANSVRSTLCKDNMPDTGCSLKVYRRACLEKIKMFNGMHRFLPALFLNEGFSMAATPVNHRERTRGTTKYNFFNRSLNTVADMLAVCWMRKRSLHYTITKKIP